MIRCVMRTLTIPTISGPATSKVLCLGAHYGLCGPWYADYTSRGPSILVHLRSGLCLTHPAGTRIPDTDAAHSSLVSIAAMLLRRYRDILYRPDDQPQLIIPVDLPPSVWAEMQAYASRRIQEIIHGGPVIVPHDPSTMTQHVRDMVAAAKAGLPWSHGATVVTKLGEIYYRRRCIAYRNQGGQWVANPQLPPDPPRAVLVRLAAMGIPYHAKPAK